MEINTDLCEIESNEPRFIVTRLLTFLSGCFLILGNSEPATAQAWKKPSKTIDATIGVSIISASQQYDKDGEAFSLLDGKGDVSQFSSSFRLEYMPVENLGLFLETELKTIGLSGPTFESNVSGFGDIRFGTGYVLTTKKSPVGLVIGAAITAPTGYSPNLGDFVPVLGQGVNVYEVFILSGKRFDGGLHFLLSTGYRLHGGRAPRGGGPTLTYSDQIPINAKFGYWLTDQWSVSVIADAKFALGDPQKIEHVEFVNRAQSYTSAGVEAEYRLNDAFYVSANGLLDLLGRNRLVQTRFGLNVGVVLEVGK